MPNSWDQTIRRLAEEERVWDQVRFVQCSAPKCKEQAVFLATYKYVTGRAGRVSWAERHYCTKHAERFAAKNGLEMPR